MANEKCPDRIWLYPANRSVMPPLECEATGEHSEHRTTFFGYLRLADQTEVRIPTTIMWET